MLANLLLGRLMFSTIRPQFLRNYSSLGISKKFEFFFAFIFNNRLTCAGFFEAESPLRIFQTFVHMHLQFVGLRTYAFGKFEKSVISTRGHNGTIQISYDFSSRIYCLV